MVGCTDVPCSDDAHNQISNWYWRTGSIKA
jgi:hypothetical protein